MVDEVVVVDILVVEDMVFVIVEDVLSKMVLVEVSAVESIIHHDEANIHHETMVVELVVVGIPAI